MRKHIIGAIFVVALLIPATASANSMRAKYKVLYHQVAHKFGSRAPGRNILRDGLRGRPASDKDIAKSVGVLERMLAPPPAPAPAPVAAPTTSSTYSAPAAAVTPAVTASAASSGGSLPSCTWQPESGGNYNAVNSSSGAYGKYQIMPSTSSAYGCNMSTPSGQDACAQTIWSKQGPSAWVNC